MRAALSALVLVLLTGAALAEVKIAGSLQVPANHLVRLSADGAPAGSALVWDVAPDEVADVEEVGGRLLFAAPAGTYRIKLRAIRLKDGATVVESARAVVVIGDGHGPGPDPSPEPDRPKPKPPPDDLLLAALRTAYAGESSSDRVANLDALTALYWQSARLVRDESLTTWGALFSSMSAKATLVKGKLPGVQKVIQAELAKALPVKTDDPLDVAGRKKAAATFTRIYRTLAEIDR